MTNTHPSPQWRRHITARTVLVAGLLALIAGAHLWKLGAVPRGMFVDESNIGYNAMLIAESGYDEHHDFLPLFFESFGDYKQPVYIYAASLVFKIFGASDFTLRLTSFLFYVLFLAAMLLLLREWRLRSFPLIAYALLTAGFLPWFFTLSRIAFEVISQITVVMFALLFVHKTYVDDRPKTTLYATLAGACTGLSVYTYHSSRLLAFFFLLSVVVIYSYKSTFRRSAVLAGAFLVAIVPYLINAMLHPGAMTARFRNVTYIFDASLTFWQKTTVFFWNYFQYFSPRFLIVSGDPNLRHATGYGGEVFVIMVPLALVGMAWILLSDRVPHRRFGLLLICNMLAAPTAAALTSEATPHALRSILLGLFVLLLSFYGFALLSRIRMETVRAMVVGLVLFSVCLDASSFVQDYFTRYAGQSQDHFGSYGIPEALAFGIAHKPESITLWPGIDGAHLDFYARTAKNPDGIRIAVSEDRLVPGGCVVFAVHQTPDMDSGNIVSFRLPGSAVETTCITSPAVAAQ